MFIFIMGISILITLFVVGVVVGLMMVVKDKSSETSLAKRLRYAMYKPEDYVIVDGKYYAFSEMMIDRIDSVVYRIATLARDEGINIPYNFYECVGSLKSFKVPESPAFEKIASITKQTLVDVTETIKNGDVEASLQKMAVLFSEEEKTSLLYQN